MTKKLDLSPQELEVKRKILILSRKLSSVDPKEIEIIFNKYSEIPKSYKNIDKLRRLLFE